MRKNFWTILLTALTTAVLMTGCSNELKDSHELNSTSTTESEQMNSQKNTTDTEATPSSEPLATYAPLSEGDAAPDFTASLSDGSSFTLSEQTGKVVLLNFWATWCGPCRDEMPAFEQLNDEYGNDVMIVAVNYMEDEDTVNRFISDNGYTFPIAYDVDGSITMKYPSDGIPYTLVIGTDGTIQKLYVGAYSAEIQYQLYKEDIDTALQQAE